MELLITVEFEANVCLNVVPWTTTKMKPSLRTNRRANIGGLYLESREIFIQISIANTYNYCATCVPDEFIWLSTFNHHCVYSYMYCTYVRTYTRLCQERAAVYVRTYVQYVLAFIVAVIVLVGALRGRVERIFQSCRLTYVRMCVAMNLQCNVLLIPFLPRPQSACLPSTTEGPLQPGGHQTCHLHPRG